MFLAGLVLLGLILIFKFVCCTVFTCQKNKPLASFVEWSSANDILDLYVVDRDVVL
jgi:hypothetical protein